ncbi:MAG: hypothetical protein AMJ91_00610 [candidate division Zixibacteria bacterium SM23_73_3]|nr:MAG: hypothetical protein AMJ91_00610 [candidate division Zixibacteria bacterium SM23_73_3]
MNKNAPGGLWEAILGGFALLLKPFLSVGGVISAILMGGVFVDWNLLLVDSVKDRFACGFGDRPDILAICIALFLLSQALFQLTAWAIGRKVKYEPTIPAQSATAAKPSNTEQPDAQKEH